MRRALALIAAGSFAVAACVSGVNSAPVTDGPGSVQQLDGQAPRGSTTTVSGAELVTVDPLFDRATIFVGGKRLDVAIADTAEKRSRGLMFVTDMGDIDGMLFVFHDAEVRSFWMRNTRLALDVVYFDGEGVPVGAHLMAPCPDADIDCPGYPSTSPATYALETAAGVFDFGAAVLDVATVP